MKIKHFPLCTTLVIIFYSFNLHAGGEIKNYFAKDYKTAKSEATRLRFESKSTKLGFITTDFDGFAKKFSINYVQKANMLEQVKIKIDARSFDTNSDARNEK